MHGAFVVQLGAEEAGGREDFSGRVEEVDSGQSVRFRSEEELLDFLRMRRQETVAERAREH